MVVAFQRVNGTGVPSRQFTGKATRLYKLPGGFSFRSTHLDRRCCRGAHGARGYRVLCYQLHESASHQVMRCEVCKRELAENEAVYRAAVGKDGSFSLFHGNVGSVCADCAVAITGRTWFARTCSNCQRSVFLDRVRRNLRYLFCSSECRKAASYARKRQRIRPRPCNICGQTFTPRSDKSRYCSLTCQLEAFRRRRAAERRT
jgi:hypothetical protein